MSSIGLQWVDDDDPMNVDLCERCLTSVIAKRTDLKTIELLLDIAFSAHNFDLPNR
jgi:hypothetical protein